MKTKLNMIACVAMAVSTPAWAVKDITTRVNPDSSLNVEARYCVHVGLTAYNAGLTSSTVGIPSATAVTGNPNTGETGIVEYASCGGLSGAGNWGRVNNGVITYSGDGNFAPSTSGGTGPDYFGYLFNAPVKNLTEVRWWNTVFVTGVPYGGGTTYQGGAGGGMFAAEPELQYLDAPAPHGAWHTITGVSWSTPYDTSLPAVDATVRPYVITITADPGTIWGLRLYGAPKATGNTIDTDGWVTAQELAVVADLDIGDIDLTRNLASMNLAQNPGTAIISVVHAPFNPDANPVLPTPPENVLIDGRFDTRVDTYAFGAPPPDRNVDWFGVSWAAPRHRLRAVGISLVSFGDGGWFDDCELPVTVEYTTDNTNWIPVTGLDKGRYPDIWQRLWWDGAQMSFLFRFDEVGTAVAIRVKGGGNSQADGDGFVGAYEFEVFGVPVVGEVCNFDNSADGDVDATDLSLFMDCWSGPEVPFTTTPNCANRDLDADGDVDNDDFAVFQRCFSGAGIAADPFCG